MASVRFVKAEWPGEEPGFCCAACDGGIPPGGEWAEVYDGKTAVVHKGCVEKYLREGPIMYRRGNYAL